jgi:hypothetical protein
MKMIYIVTYSKALELPIKLGRFESLDDATTAARAAGAVGDSQRCGEDRMYGVEGREGNDDFAIWIEAK